MKRYSEVMQELRKTMDAKRKATEAELAKLKAIRDRLAEQKKAKQ